jgi:sulfate transport system ATP-binding protein
MSTISPPLSPSLRSWLSSRSSPSSPSSPSSAVPRVESAFGPPRAISVEDVSKGFGEGAVLDRIALAIEPGELLALLGPSGSGKTTLLRLLAGLETPDAGRVLFDGEDAARYTVQQRRVGFVFQSYALFRHMSVFDNIAYGLTVRARAERPSRAAIAARVAQLLEMMQLSGYERRFPHELSGGQRQRVALARALAIEPRMLLLDEPFGALDAKVRKDLRKWLRDIHDRTGLTTVFVTHDQAEAMDIADRVAILNRGRIEQIGRPADVRAAPATEFVREFLD